MEGLEQLPTRKIPAAPRPLWSGLALAAAIAAAANGIHLLPFAPFQVGAGSAARHPISAAIIAILGGVLVRNLLPLRSHVIEGGKRVARAVIPATIVLIGASLDLGRIAAVGIRSFAITVVCIALAFFAAIWFGRLLNVWPKTYLLIAAGTAICGTSAIVAVAPLIEAADEDLMLSIGTVNILGLLLMFALPAMGTLLHMKDDAFGVWAGTSIHAVPQVVAAAFAFSAPAGTLATLVKLVRVALLAPFLFIVGLTQARREGRSRSVGYSKLVPGFVWGFLSLALLNTSGLLPILQFRFGSAPLANLLADLGELLLTLSMAAMGMEVNIRFFARVGGRAVLTGAAASVALCTGSYVLIYFLM